MTRFIELETEDGKRLVNVDEIVAVSPFGQYAGIRLKSHITRKYRILMSYEDLKKELMK